MLTETELHEIRGRAERGTSLRADIIKLLEHIEEISQPTSTLGTDPVKSCGYPYDSDPVLQQNPEVFDVNL